MSLKRHISPHNVPHASVQSAPVRQKAFDLYLGGQVVQALAVAEQAVTHTPHDIHLLNLAAICHKRLGNPEQAIVYWQQALGIKPDYVDALNNMGILLKNLKRFEEAESAYRQALGIKPDYAEAYNNLGVLQKELKQFEAAEASYRQAVRLKPDYAEAYNNLGHLLQDLTRFEEAEAAYRQTLRIQPNHVEACNTLGFLLQELKRPEEAEAAYRQALRLTPNHADALNNLGNLLQEQERLEEAEVVYRQALNVRPDFVELYNNLGHLLHTTKRFEEAEATYRQALRLTPDFVEVHNNLGLLMKERDRFEEAEAAYRQALRLKPEDADAQWNASLLYLSLGRFQEGWPLYEARHHPDKKKRTVLPIKVPFPMWKGEDLTGKSLLIVPEQAFGDQIQFCRYVTQVRALGVSRITLVCMAPLEALLASLARAGSITIARETDLYPPHDFWTFYMSLPGLLATTPDTIPDRLPYLSAPSDRLASWAHRVPRQGLRVGLSWKGSPAHKNDASRSLSGLEVLAPLWSIPGVSFVGLQKGYGAAEHKASSFQPPLVPLGGAIMDFADTAAIITHLDGVISVDSAVAHLAGALGKPCWVLVPAWGTDWRWMYDRTDSPWYPNVMRLFRQTKPDDWSTVVQRVAEELAREVQAREARAGQ